MISIKLIIKRTIPTGVGKTGALCTLSGFASDHPHGRGENECVICFIRRVNGPSPRAWGKHLTNNVSYVPKRTIPTGVGKTPTSWSDFVLHILYLVDIQLSNNFGSQLHAFSR